MHSVHSNNHLQVAMPEASVRERVGLFEGHSRANSDDSATPNSNRSSRSRSRSRGSDASPGRRSPVCDGEGAIDQSPRHKISTSEHRPPPVPKKSMAVREKLEAMQLTQHLPPSINGQKVHRYTEKLLPDFELQGAILMVENDTRHDNINIIEEAPPSESWKPPKPPRPVRLVSEQKELTESSEANGTETFFKSIQKPFQGGPINIIAPNEMGRKISQMFNPILSNAKSGLDKTAEVTKPGLETVGNGFRNVGSGMKTAIDKTGVPRVFLQTQDDLSDATERIAALIKESEGLCSKCQKLPRDLQLSEPGDVSQTELKWATPLSRVLYHAEWCRVCHLLLDMLCKSENDPFKHPAIYPYLQPELHGYSMQDWVSRGWKEADEHWPFGHGEKRHEGASYILGPTGSVLSRLLRASIHLAIRTELNTSSRRRRPTREVRKDWRHKEQLKNAKSPPQYPLSCLITVTSAGPQTPGLLYVSLVGYGRKLGADLEILTNFRLRAISPNPLSILNNGVGADSSSFSYGRFLNPEWIDPSVGQLWLQECERNHGTTCGHHERDLGISRPGFLRVIDVEDLCIKVASDSCRYIALSYVWGQVPIVKLLHANARTLMQKNGLLKILQQLPHTILDAIEVVKAMGERYLWTDALCILQDDKTEATEQIGTMDLVYGSSLATIIAADGLNADSGLGGVPLSQWSNIAPQISTGRQRPSDSLAEYRRAEITKEISLAAPLAVTDHNLSSSIWNSRAWTFQERILSRRLIIFSHGQMIWHCRGMVCREDMTVTDSGAPYKPLRWLALNPRAGDSVLRHFDDSTERTRYGTTQLVRSTRFAEYAKAVEEYTHRQMSHQSDALNAFAGLLRIFANSFQCETISGLPTKHLDVSLLWRPAQQLKRRSGFPSWSWAGWIGQVEYETPYRVYREADGKFTSFNEDTHGEEGIRPLIRWYILEKPPVTSHHHTAPVQPLNGTGIGFPYDSHSLPREWENKPYTSQSTKNPPLPANHRDGSSHSEQLYFHASCTSKFILGNRVTQKGNTKYISTSRYWLLDTDSFVIGNILLDSIDMTWKSQKRYDFIQLAEAQYSGIDGEEKDLEDYPFYVVMLVEWDEKGGVVERKGLGRVSKEAWKVSGPKIKTIRLG